MNFNDLYMKGISENMNNAKKEVLAFYKENKSITILFVISIIINILYGVTDNLPELFVNADFWFNLLRQICLSIIASFTFYIFIQYIPTKKENNKFTKIVLEQIRHPIVQHVRLLMYMYKASISTKPINLPSSIHELFKGDFFTVIEELDLNAQAPVVKDQTWSCYMYNECLLFSQRIETVLIKYSFYLNYELLELLESLNKTLFMRIVLEGDMARRMTADKVWKHEENIFKYNSIGNTPNQFFKTKYENKNILDEHVKLILEVVDTYNKFNSEKYIRLDMKLWSETIAPLYGDARFDLGSKT